VSYTDSHLLPDETIRYRARLHWLPFLPAYLLGVFFIVVGIAGLAMETWWLGIGGSVVGIATFIWIYIAKATSEFCVTDRRVVIKVGFIQRRTVETMLGKVESIGVDQGLIGRLFDFGSILVVGTGGTQDSFHNISNPLEFRRQVQAEASALDSKDDARPSRPRDERECPFCAELILRKARVCRYCGRDVEPVTA
jgi:uncharacterized membrane protein YdbT with pleckstrin-like domain